MNKNYDFEKIYEGILTSDLYRHDSRNLYKRNRDFFYWQRLTPQAAKESLRKKLQDRVQRHEMSILVKRLMQELIEDPNLFTDFNEQEDEDVISTNVENGILFFRRGKKFPILEHHASYSVQKIIKANVLRFSYKENAGWNEAPTWRKFLLDTFEESNVYTNSIVLFLQILAYTTVPELFGAKKMFLFLGAAHSGKSTILKFIRFIVGEEDYVPLGIEELSNRFRSSLLIGTRLVINDELPAKQIKNLDQLKKIIAGEPIILERKGKDAEKYIPKVKLLMAGNQLPTPKDYDFHGAWIERLCVLVFPHSTEKSKWDLHLFEKLKEERDVIMSLAMKTVPSLIASNYQFVSDQRSEQYLNTYREDVESIMSFINDPEMCRKGAEYKEHYAVLYDAYSKYCKNNALSVYSMADFRQQLEQAGFHRERFRKGTENRYGVRGIELVNNMELLKDGVENVKI